jgi:hypothetical protein
MLQFASYIWLPRAICCAAGVASSPARWASGVIGGEQRRRDQRGQAAGEDVRQLMPDAKGRVAHIDTEQLTEEGRLRADHRSVADGISEQ